jgi:hypothetical protein
VVDMVDMVTVVVVDAINPMYNSFVIIHSDKIRPPTSVGGLYLCI